MHVNDRNSSNCASTVFIPDALRFSVKLPSFVYCFTHPFTPACAHPPRALPFLVYSECYCFSRQDHPRMENTCVPAHMRVGSRCGGIKSSSHVLQSDMHSMLAPYATCISSLHAFEMHRYSTCICPLHVLLLYVRLYAICTPPVCNMHMP